MIVINGTARLSDADGAREKMVPAVAAMVEASRAEPGCQSIRYGWDLADPNTMMFCEVYDDMAALQAHLQTPHMKAFYEAGGGLMAGRPDVTMYVNAEVGQMGPGGA